jgi:polyribonucleotide nucleotidyltransferase
MSHKFDIQTVSIPLGGRTLTLETGRLAKQADASIFVSYGDSRILVTACSAKDPKPGIDFMPLTVEFAERHYSAGHIPEPPLISRRLLSRHASDRDHHGD